VEQAAGGAGRRRAFIQEVGMPPLLSKALTRVGPGVHFARGRAGLPRLSFSMHCFPGYFIVLSLAFALRVAAPPPLGHAFPCMRTCHLLKNPFC